VFSYILDEVLMAFESSKNCNLCKVGSLHKDHILFVNECLRFMSYAYIFFNDEDIITTFFNKVKGMTSSKKQSDGGKFEQLLTALVYFMGSQMLRENCMLLLYIAVYQQLWICTKVQKSQAPNGQLMRNVTVLIPDFCQESLFQLIPYTIQAIRMPAREDLMLTDEQKMYVMSRFDFNYRVNMEVQQMDAVAGQFIGTVEGMRAQDYGQTLVVGVSVWKNYLLSTQQMRDPLVSQYTFGSLIELLKVLPTKEQEYYNLGDFLGHLAQIINSQERM